MLVECGQFCKLVCHFHCHHLAFAFIGLCQIDELFNLLNSFSLDCNNYGYLQSGCFNRWFKKSIWSFQSPFCHFYISLVMQAFSSFPLKCDKEVEYFYCSVTKTYE